MNRLTITASLAAALLAAQRADAQAACLYGGCGSTPNTGPYTWGSACNTPGLTCFGVGSGCFCETVNLSYIPYNWQECMCVPNAIAEWSEYLCSGAWGASASPGLAMGSTSSCSFAFASNNRFDIFDAADIIHGSPSAVSTPTNVQTIATAGGLNGGMAVQVLSSPSPASVPVRLIGVTLSIAPFTVRGQSTGPNTFMMTGDAMSGTWNQTTGFITFPNPVTGTLSNGLFSGAPATFQPMFKGNPGPTLATFTVQPTMKIGLPDTGSCCNPASGSCSITVQANCVAPGGWLSGVSCTPSNPCPQPTGACCRASTCVQTTAAACPNQTGQHFSGVGVACNGPGNRRTPCCAVDFNQSGAVGIQDVFDFVAAWLAADMRADFNNSGALGVQDIFDFLAAWFVGCN